MKKYKPINILLILIFALLEINCSYFKSKVIDNIKVKEIKSVKLSKIPIPFISSKTEFTFILGILNDNPFDIVLKKTDYDVYINNTKIGNGVSKKEQVLIKNRINGLSLGFSFDAGEILINGISLIEVLSSNEQLEFKLVGNLTTISESKEYIVPFKIVDLRKIIQ